MRKAIVVIAVLGLVVMAGRSASAQQTLLDSVAKGCEKELTTFCKDVTPGEGRVLACLYAFQDKVSARCEYALYDAASQLERAVTALAYAANECRDDLRKFCADVQPGQGRMLNCLGKNEANLSKRCKDARKDTGLR